MAAIWVESLMSMPTPPSVPLPLPPAETSIIDDLPCRSCGYNLRTLATGGLCPECSTPVSASLGGELLRHADPNWLSDMNTAGQWVRGGTFVLYAFWVVLPPFPFIRHVFEAAAAAAIIMAGTWQLTVEDRPLPFVSLLFVFQGLTTFLSALKDEVAAATRPTRPTMWRTAGAFIYWIRQFFRSKNGDSQ